MDFGKFGKFCPPLLSYVLNVSIYAASVKSILDAIESKITIKRLSSFPGVVFKA